MTKLRAFKTTDISAMTKIYAHYVRIAPVTFDIDPPDDATMAKKFEGLIAEGYPVIIAEKNGELLGYAYASSYRPKPGYRFTCENTIYLKPGNEGQGLGSLLLAELIAQCRVKGFKQMIAVIEASTTASLRLHEKFGFKQVGHYPAIGHKFGRWLDIIHMQKGLDEDGTLSCLTSG